MQNLEIPIELLEYYNKINHNWKKLDIPLCPKCKSKMQYIKHEFMEYKNEFGTIRKFKCINCIEKEITLWRK